jgi:hypothetical protein
LTPGTNGTSGSRITISAGAYSSSPSGHNGTVIIDGGNSRTTGININSRSYITITGGTATEYKMLVQNVANGNGSVYIRGTGNYVDYVQITNSTSRGAYLNYSVSGRLKGCDIRTGNVSNNYQTDGIYIQYGSDNIIENNTVVLGNNVTDAHVDAFQVSNGEARMIVRNNWFEWTDGRGASTCQVAMIAAPSEYYYFYNNVFIAGNVIPYQGILAGGYLAGYTGDLYFWNNTIVAKGTAIPLRIDTTLYPSNYSIGAVKNNIIASVNSTLLDTYSITPATSKIQNNLYYRASGTTISTIGSTNRTWVAHKAVGYDTTGVNANPDYNVTTYILNSTSPAINVGTDLSAYFTTDKAGNTRSGTWDIGAYEYGGDVVIPVPVTGCTISATSGISFR